MGQLTYTRELLAAKGRHKFGRENVALCGVGATQIHTLFHSGATER